VLFWGSWKIPVFYSVIETRDFLLVNQSAQALLKGYFIILNCTCEDWELLQWYQLVTSANLSVNKVKYFQFLWYRILSIILFWPFEGGGGGAYLRGAYLGGAHSFLVKLYDNFPPAQKIVCKTTMYSNNFNTIVLINEMFNYIFFNYSAIYMF
jgi:hypothetical protein